VISHLVLTMISKVTTLVTEILRIRIQAQIIRGRLVDTRNRHMMTSLLIITLVKRHQKLLTKAQGKEKEKLLLTQKTTGTRVRSKHKIGKILIRYTKDMFIFVWMDIKPVRILSTFSSPEIEVFPHISVPNLMMKKPKAIREYNHVMPGVDGADQMRHIKTITRQQQKNPYKKVIY
jgi:hypothetical protein